MSTNLYYGRNTWQGQVDGSGEEPFPIMSGRDVYNSRSYTGLNRSPVEDHISYILAGIEVQGEPDIKPYDMTEALLVDGSIVTFERMSLMPDVYAEEENAFIQYIRQEPEDILDFRVDGNDMTDVRSHKRYEYELGDRWTQYEVTFNDEGVEEEREIVDTFEANTYDVFPNRRGILYFPQEIFWLLEENKTTQRALMRGSNVLPIVDSDQQATSWNTALNAARRMVLGQFNQIHDPTSSDTMNALETESNELRMDWCNALNCVEKDTPQRPSGADREIRGRAMINFIRTARTMLQAIYAELGTTIEFRERVITASAAERIAQADLIDRLAAQNVLTNEEIRDARRQLV